MNDASGTAVIVFNGEIYNFRELRAQLEAEGYGFRGHSDTERLLALHRARGEAMPLLNGIFAFAIYDQAERKLFLACDTMGVKPLYFNEGHDGFVFASELKALVACGGVAGSLDVSALFRDRAVEHTRRALRVVRAEVRPTCGRCRVSALS